MKALFYCYDQDPLGFCFLVQIRAFVIQSSLGQPNLNMKRKTKRILVVVVKRRASLFSRLRACLHGSRGPQVGEVTRLGGVKK